MVWEEIGLTVSIGVSFSMSAEKLSSVLREPCGISAVEKHEFEQIVWPLFVPDLFHVAEPAGIYTIGFPALSILFLRQVLWQIG